MKLYYSETPNPHKPCAVAKYLQIPVDYVRVDLGRGEHKHPAYLSINPNGKTPALEDGDISLWEAHAIMVYLAHKSGSDLWPEDALDQIEVMKWLNWDTAHFSRHAGRLWFQNFFKGVIGAGEPDPAEIEDAMGFFRQFAGVLDDHMKGRDHVVGDSLTIADFGVATFMPRWKEAGLPLEDYPQISRWHDRMATLDAWTNPWPANYATLG
ncbi:MAG: glutathione S-transferase family protein [Alphaproteobacteria bacterium]|nr:glutathione S-transferase family protein [Alphaproteobacteria bacterium]